VTLCRLTGSALLAGLSGLVRGRAAGSGGVPELPGGSGSTRGGPNRTDGLRPRKRAVRSGLGANSSQLRAQMAPECEGGGNSAPYSRRSAPYTRGC
jgi:hypothetical protein